MTTRTRRAPILWAGAGALLLHAAVMAVALQQPLWAPYPLNNALAGSSFINARSVTLGEESPAFTPVIEEASNNGDPFTSEGLPPLNAPQFDAKVNEEAINPSLHPGYVPRAQLTTPPSAMGAILLNYPDDVPAGHFSAEFTLFIEADGVVSRIRHDQGTLPRALMESVLAAFGAAKFSPGKIDAQNVPSRTLIQVEFNADADTREIGSPALTSPGG